MDSNLKFVIYGSPRTGSTSIARVLGSHPEASCLIEPFHPSRYGGSFHELAIAKRSLTPALALIGAKWHGIKHVTEAATGWPFESQRELNLELLLATRKVICVRRKNLLRRYVSHVLCRSINFWIGTKAEFADRLETCSLPTLRVSEARASIEAELNAARIHRDLFLRNKIDAYTITYEELFPEKADSRDQHKHVNEILRFIGCQEWSFDLFQRDAAKFLSAAEYRWNVPEVYERIPGAANLERVLGSDETGWLFQ